jgi:death on curing protein
VTRRQALREPLWLSVGTVKAIHADQIAEHRGIETSTDEAKLGSALARAQQRFAYAESPPSLAELAAEYAFGIARNHPFTDGNKRVAFMAAYVFLRINGLQLQAEEVDAVMTIQALAAGELSVEQLAAWLAQNSVKAKRRR